MLLQQDMSGCELILVNDGSTDNTLSILQAYESSPNIVILSQANQGVSVARNVGLSVARGRYVYFLDSDDKLPSGTIAKWSKWLTNAGDLDILIFGYVSLRENKIVRNFAVPNYDKRYFSGEELLKLFLLKKIFVHNSSCLYSKAFLQKNNFQYKAGIKIAEDVEWLIKVFAVAHKVFYFKDICWNYVIRENSAIHINDKYSNDFFESFLLLKNVLTELGQRKIQLLKACNFFIGVSYSINLYRYITSKYYDARIEREFVREKRVLFSPLSYTGMYTYILWLMRFCPISLVLRSRSAFHFLFK